MSIHHQIAPIEVYVREKFLYNMDESKRDRIPAKVFCLSSYPGDTLTVQAVLENGALFSYLPLHSLLMHHCDDPHYGLEDLVYKNCPSGNLVMHTHKHLQGRVQAYLKRKNEWSGAEYMQTLDWYNDNEQMHLVTLDSGQIALLPNHKVLFGEKRDLPRYKKMRRDWLL